MIKNLVVDCTDMKWGVSAGIPRVHVRPVEQEVLQVLHHPVPTHLDNICHGGEFAIGHDEGDGSDECLHF